MIFVKLKIKYDAKKQNRKHRDAVNKAIEKSMFPWEIEAKMITTLEKHIITGTYKGSINQEGTDDGIHEEIAYNRWRTGSNVEYAIFLEKRYGIFMRALDNSRDRILKMFGQTYMQNI